MTQLSVAESGEFQSCRNTEGPVIENTFLPLQDVDSHLSRASLPKSHILLHSGVFVFLADGFCDILGIS